MAAIWQIQSWNWQMNLTVSLRMCLTKVNTPKSPSLIARLLSWKDTLDHRGKSFSFTQTILDDNTR